LKRQAGGANKKKQGTSVVKNNQRNRICKRKGAGGRRTGVLYPGGNLDGVNASRGGIPNKLCVKADNGGEIIKKSA